LSRNAEIFGVESGSRNVPEMKMGDCDWESNTFFWLRTVQCLLVEGEHRGGQGDLTGAG
jgi:hypothetical protein